MTLFEELQTAKTEEDVKDIYIKRLKLKGFSKNLIDIQTKEVWFEAKIGAGNSTYKMFTQLLRYVWVALKNGEEIPPFLCVIDSVKAAIMETKVALPLLQDKTVEIKWGKSASDVSQDALEKVSQYIGTHFVTFNIKNNEEEFIAAVHTAIEKGEIIRSQITPDNLKQVFDKWVEMIGREIKGVPEEKYALLFFADIMSDGTVSTHENLPAELIHKGNKPAFILDGKVYDLGNFDGYRRFWAIYDRPPKEEYRNYLLERRDSLIPTDERSFKGAYYTPLKVVEKAYDLLSKTLGKNWQRDYIVWDMCCGVGNLETKHSNHRNLFMSTLDEADIDVMKAAKTCVQAERFQYDYLNDDITDDGTIDYSLTGKIPSGLRKILENCAESTRVQNTDAGSVSPQISSPVGNDASSVVGKKTCVVNSLGSSHPDAGSVSSQICSQIGNDASSVVKENIINTYGNLPHIHKECVPQFVTFRLFDSLPAEKLAEYELLKEDLEKKKSRLSDAGSVSSQICSQIGNDASSVVEESDIDRNSFILQEKINKWLDAGYGECLLKNTQVQNILSTVLKHFDGERYILHSFVIMPNHVHVLFTPINGNIMQDILHSWKSFSANKINEFLNRKGQLWMKESFDRYIRNENHFLKTLEYIQNNPIGFFKEEYCLYIADDVFGFDTKAEKTKLHGSDAGSASSLGSSHPDAGSVSSQISPQIGNDASSVVLAQENSRRKDASSPKFLVLINPPYAETTNADNASKGADAKNKTGVKRTKMAEVGMKEYGKASNELFMQFVARIAKEIPNATIAMFSTLKYVNSQAFEQFRNVWNAKFLDGFVVHSKAFDGLKGDFPIGFLIWKTHCHVERNDSGVETSFSKPAFPKEITCEVLDKDANPIGEKKFYNLPAETYLSTWIDRPKADGEPCVPLTNAITPPQSARRDQRGTRMAKNAIGYMISGTNDFQHQNYICVLSSGASMGHGIFIAEENLWQCAVYFCVTKLIDHTWQNHNDQFLQPNCELPEEFKNDCLIWMLFNGKNLTASADGLEWNGKTWSIVNHFIPFTETEVGAPERFESDFMVRYIEGKTFSEESLAVLSEGKKLWTEYFKKTDEYKIRDELKLNRADVGWYQIRNALKKRTETGDTLPTNFAPFESAYKTLTEKLRPLVFDFGFLR